MWWMIKGVPSNNILALSNWVEVLDFHVCNSRLSRQKEGSGKSSTIRKLITGSAGVLRVEVREGQQPSKARIAVSQQLLLHLYKLR